MSTKAFVKDIAKQMGNHTIDQVVLNAGILHYPNVSLSFSASDLL